MALAWQQDTTSHHDTVHFDTSPACSAPPPA